MRLPNTFGAEAHENIVTGDVAIYLVPTLEVNRVNGTMGIQEFGDLFLEWENSGYSLGVLADESYTFTEGNTKENLPVRGLGGGRKGFKTITESVTTMEFTIVELHNENLVRLNTESYIDADGARRTRRVITDTEAHHAVAVEVLGANRYKVDILYNAESQEAISIENDGELSSTAVVLQGSPMEGDEGNLPYKQYNLG